MRLGPCRRWDRHRAVDAGIIQMTGITPVLRRLPPAAPFRSGKELPRTRGCRSWPDGPRGRGARLFVRQGFFFFARHPRLLVLRNRRRPSLLLRDAVRRADHAAPLWLDLAEGRLRLDRLCRNSGGETFFPWASPIPREARKSHRRHPPLTLRPASRCVVDRLRPADRHRGRGGRGLENSKEQ